MRNYFNQHFAKKYGTACTKFNNPLFPQQKVELQETYQKPQDLVDEDRCVSDCKVDIIS